MGVCKRVCYKPQKSTELFKKKRNKMSIMITSSLLSFITLTTFYCVVRQSISPCTCTRYSQHNTIVDCNNMQTFSDVVDALQDRFASNHSIRLNIVDSILLDLGNRSFAEMNLKVKHLRLNNVTIEKLAESSFLNMTSTQFLGLTDNPNITEVPSSIFEQLPKVETLDIARSRLRAVRTDDFKALQLLKHLVLASNCLERVEEGAFPPSMVTLHIGKNRLTSLNGTLRHLYDLKLLFINNNNLTTLDDQLPAHSKNLIMIMAKDNLLDALPEDMTTLSELQSVFVDGNRLRTLNYTFAHASKLIRILAHHNNIEYLATDEFQNAASIDELNFSFNQLTSLNGSLLPITKLRVANFSFNSITQFSLAEIRELDHLTKLELSHNRIVRLLGYGENQIEPRSGLVELRLEHNLLESLDGHLMGLNKLRILDVSSNRLKVILPEDLIGMQELEYLDLSFNQIKTLQETAKTYLPSLEMLNASYNLLTELRNDFHGLPVLCMADLSNNQITLISKNLVANTRCSNHGVPNKLEIILAENPILCHESVSTLYAEMENQLARVTGNSHCIVPQEFMIRLPTAAPLQPQLSPVVMSQSPNMQLPGAPAVVQVLVPMPSKAPNLPIVATMDAVATTTTTAPVTVSGNVPSISTTTTTTTTTTGITLDEIVPMTTAATTMTPTETIDIKNLDSVEESPAGYGLGGLPGGGPALHIPISLHNLKYSSENEPSIDAANDRANGIEDVDKHAQIIVPQVLMAPMTDNSQLKLVMDRPDDDPPEVLNDQEVPPNDE